MSKTEKIAIGALGGLCAVLVKFLGQDYNFVIEQAANLTPEQVSCYKIGYGIITPILMFLGAFVAWISDETKRIKIAALAVAAPAMITTWSGGVKSDVQPMQPIGGFIITAAHAQQSGAQRAENVENIEFQKQETDNITKIKKGIAIFFGYDKAPKRYWVVVGNYNEKHFAQEFANRINAEDSTINAWVGAKMPPHHVFPVVVGNYCLYSDAIKLKEKALSLETIAWANLSQDVQR